MRRRRRETGTRRLKNRAIWTSFNIQTQRVSRRSSRVILYTIDQTEHFLQSRTLNRLSISI